MIDLTKYNKTIKITGINERGYGEGHVDNKKYFVLNALPGEKVAVKIVKKKNQNYFGIAEEVLERSSYRIKACDDHFYSCSPLQILKLEEENKWKITLIKDFYRKFADIELPDFEIISDLKEYHYRNKVEFSFYGDEHNKLHLAFHKRDGRNAKYIVSNCCLLPDQVNIAANDILTLLNEKGIGARELKGLMLRYSFHENKTIAVIYCKNSEIRLNLDHVKNNNLKSIILIYSDPKSPAFIESKILQTTGEGFLIEKIGDLKFKYPYNSFFQVNPAMFLKTINDIQKLLQDISNYSQLNVTDVYAGVGTIGLSISRYANHVNAIESTASSDIYALENAVKNKIKNYSFQCGKAEDIFQDINDIVILDPPRSGLHPKVKKLLINNLPSTIFYLSCNPKTQAMDLNELKNFYEIKYIKAYNYYPHTPHIECLIKLNRIQ